MDSPIRFTGWTTIPLLGNEKYVPGRLLSKGFSSAVAPNPQGDKRATRDRNIVVAQPWQTPKNADPWNFARISNVDWWESWTEVEDPEGMGCISYALLHKSELLTMKNAKVLVRVNPLHVPPGVRQLVSHWEYSQV